jgi:hypothetical protein
VVDDQSLAATIDEYGRDGGLVTRKSTKVPTIDTVIFEFALNDVCYEVVTDTRDELSATAQLDDGDSRRCCGATADRGEPCRTIFFGSLWQLRCVEDEILHRVADAQHPLHVNVTS